jgi:hypothetical protein
LRDVEDGVVIAPWEMVDGFLIPAAERLGNLRAVWQRLRAALRAALARWSG